MKKAKKWIKRILLLLVISLAISPSLLCGFAILRFKGLEIEWNAMNDPAESTLVEIGLNSYTEYAPWNVLTIAGSFSAFELPRYDNHVDNTNLHAGIMDHAANSGNWYLEETTTAEYMDTLKTYIPDAAFLYPKSDLIFEAKYLYFTGTESAKLAFFDQDTGLIIYLCTYHSPPLDSTLRINQLSIPHNGYIYEVETHGGFHGDGTTFHALTVPEAERSTLESSLSAHADWHEGTITFAEYEHLHERFYEVPPFYPAPTATFDWWCWVDTYGRQYPEKDKDVWDSDYFPAVMQESGAGCSDNWLVALYDADTGLFIYYEYDS